MIGFRTRLSLALALVTLPGTAFAHTGVDHVHGFIQGFVHPVGGLDHLLAMVMVGVFAAGIGGRALWAVPASFVGVMALAGAAGMAGVGLPHLEAGIALTVVVLGLLLALAVTPGLAVAMATVGVLAVFHGLAHGAELPAGASGVSYAAGFLLATALLHAAGALAGLVLARGGSWIARAAGAGAALTGAGLVVGLG